MFRVSRPAAMFFCLACVVGCGGHGVLDVIPPTADDFFAESVRGSSYSNVSIDGRNCLWKVFDPETCFCDARYQVELLVDSQNTELVASLRDDRGLKKAATVSVEFELLRHPNRPSSGVYFSWSFFRSSYIVLWGWGSRRYSIWLDHSRNLLVKGVSGGSVFFLLLPVAGTDGPSFGPAVFPPIGREAE